jgi:signal transduction histidine kinase
MAQTAAVHNQKGLSVPLSAEPLHERLIPMRWARVAQVIWFSVFAVNLVLLLVGLPYAHHTRQLPCSYEGHMCLTGQLTTAQYQIAQAEGLSVEAIAFVMTGFGLFELVLMSSVGAILILRKPNEVAALGIAVLALTCAVGNSDGIGAFRQISPLSWIVINAVWTINLFLRNIALLALPDGHIRPQLLGWIIIPCALCLVYMRLTSLDAMKLETSTLYGTLTNSISLLSVIAAYYRFRSFPQQRQQMKWILGGALFAGAYIIPFMALGTFFPVLGQMNHPLTQTIAISLFILARALLFVALLVAILRYRLFDIDIIIQRTLIYGSLTALVIGIYVVVIGVLSALFQTSGNLLVSLIATGIVAMLFQPLKQFLQNRITRLLFGDRNNPFQVILKLSERLESSAAPGTLLPGIAETIAQVLKLRYVSIALTDGDHFKTDGVFGQPADGGRITTLPLMYGQETVGQMVIGQGADDRALDAAERQLLDNIAQQTGIAAHAVQLSQALQQSRQQIITAREEERRRLRRDLHDGLGPSLAAHTIKVGTAKLLLESNPQTAAAILSDLETGLADSLTDIRRLVYNLRPPALDQLGLVGALRDFIGQCNGKTNITLNVTEPIPPLPAAVEVAAYRIVQEAVTNVLRHANAAQCDVNIHLGTDLLISIQDNGVGISPDAKHGIGLKSMQERAEELEGQFELCSTAGCTNIRVLLPLNGES